MRWTGMPMAMWAVFAKSFEKQLTAVLGYDPDTARKITEKAKPKYREIIAKLPKFEKGDRFSMNIIGCAMLGAFVLSMPPKDIAGMKATAARKAADRNPYSWNMDFYEYPDGSGYEGRFMKCGICTLMQELGLYDLTPAMCHLDYAMSEADGVTNFVRQYMLVSGGPY